MKTILERIENILIAFTVQYTDEKMESIKKAREMNLTLQKDLESLDIETKKLLDEKYEVAVQSKIYLFSCFEGGGDAWMW